MTGSLQTPPPQRSGSRAKAITLWLVTAAIIIPAGGGFIDKLVQFIRVLRTEDEGAFTIIPIMNYLLVAAGFFCLLVWAAARGMFRDIERPKYTLLEREARLDREDGREWSD